MEKETIVTIETKLNEKALRKKCAPFNFSKYSKQEIRDLIRRMRETMRRANGVGLSANQIGLDARVFVTQVPDAQGKPKFYAVFNPSLSKLSKEMETLEEGCLSVPETWGPTKRHYRVTLSGQDQNGKPVKLNVWGLLARVFQHEVDHLNGKLFIDTAEKVYKVSLEEKKK